MGTVLTKMGLLSIAVLLSAAAYSAVDVHAELQVTTDEAVDVEDYVVLPQERRKSALDYEELEDNFLVPQPTRSRHFVASGPLPVLETAQEGTDCNTPEGPCVFPFKYMGKTFRQCTDYGSNDEKPWCATKVDGSGKVEINSWVDCPDECLKGTDCDTPEGPCVFPFKYKGETFKQCTDYDWDKHWCATKVDGSGKMETWVNCPDECLKACKIYGGHYISAGNNAAKGTKANLQECAKWCADIPACQAWTFKSDATQCWLKLSDENKGCPGGDCDDSIWDSGTKACGADTDYFQIGGPDLEKLNSITLESTEVELAVQCCREDGLSQKILTCGGNGKPCDGICGKFPAADHATIVVSEESLDDEICPPSTQRSHALANTPVYRLNWCVFRVRNDKSLFRNPVCCFHPYVRKVRQTKCRKILGQYK